MTILVLMGGLPEDHECVIAEMMAARPGRIETLSLAGIQSEENLANVQTTLIKKRTKNDDRVTIITGVSEASSVCFLRQNNASFCHVRGPLAPVFETERIELSDYHVAPTNYQLPKPDMVLDPIELLSELEIARQQAWREEPWT